MNGSTLRQIAMAFGVPRHELTDDRSVARAIVALWSRRSYAYADVKREGFITEHTYEQILKLADAEHKLVPVLREPALSGR